MLVLVMLWLEGLSP